YSLGCILYYCLTGQYPFPDGNPVKKMLGHQLETPVPVSKFAPDAPAQLVAIVDRLLRKAPEDRYSNTDELVEELQEAAAEAHKKGPFAPATRPITPAKAPLLVESEAEEQEGTDEGTTQEREASLIPPTVWMTLAGGVAGALAGSLYWLFGRG